MAIENNPAGRLYNILDEAKTHKPTEKTAEVWAQVFGFHVDDKPQLFSTVGGLYKLLAQTREAIEKIPTDNPRYYLSPFNLIEKAFSDMHLVSVWERTAKLLDPTAMAILRSRPKTSSSFFAA